MTKQTHSIQTVNILESLDLDLTDEKKSSVLYITPTNRKRITNTVTWLIGQTRNSEFVANDALHVLLNNFEALHPGSTLIPENE